MSSQGIARVIGVGLLLFSGLIMATSGTFVVKPGFRGIEVTMGRVSPDFKPEGFGMKAPFVTEIIPISVRQQTAEELAECYSSDLQQIRVDLRLLYRIPEASVVKLFQDYDGNPFESLVAPRVQEALKEVAAMQSAELIVKNREQIKTRSLEIARRKIGSLVVLEDIVIQNISLTRELEHAIEAKMVQEQEASKSKYFQQRVQIEADTAVIKAKGLRGSANRGPLGRHRSTGHRWQRPNLVELPGPRTTQRPKDGSFRKPPGDSRRCHLAGPQEHQALTP